MGDNLSPAAKWALAKTKANTPAQLQSMAREIYGQVHRRQGPAPPDTCPRNNVEDRTSAWHGAILESAKKVPARFGCPGPLDPQKGRGRPERLLGLFNGSSALPIFQAPVSSRALAKGVTARSLISSQQGAGVSSNNHHSTKGGKSAEALEIIEVEARGLRADTSSTSTSSEDEGSSSETPHRTEGGKTLKALQTVFKSYAASPEKQLRVSSYSPTGIRKKQPSSPPSPPTIRLVPQSLIRKNNARLPPVGTLFSSRRPPISHLHPNRGRTKSKPVNRSETPQNNFTVQPDTNDFGLSQRRRNLEILANNQAEVIDLTMDDDSRSASPTPMEVITDEPEPEVSPPNNRDTFADLPIELPNFDELPYRFPSPKLGDGIPLWRNWTAEEMINALDRDTQALLKDNSSTSILLMEQPAEPTFFFEEPNSEEKEAIAALRDIFAKLKPKSTAQISSIVNSALFSNDYARIFPDGGKGGDSMEDSCDGSCYKVVQCPLYIKTSFDNKKRDKTLDSEQPASPPNNKQQATIYYDEQKNIFSHNEQQSNISQTERQSKTIHREQAGESHIRRDFTSVEPSHQKPCRLPINTAWDWVFPTGRDITPRTCSLRDLEIVPQPSEVEEPADNSKLSNWINMEMVATDEEWNAHFKKRKAEDDGRTEEKRLGVDDVFSINSGKRIRTD
ncbi:hypothetical protein ABW20_dc0104349 [Dactylellina cionopaga]|nr:hypothetical protein ABW20_dc0104349 [Dactylellina cionopaga]